MNPQTLEPVVCTVSSYNYLHYTLNLIRSIHKCWTAKPTIYVFLLDYADLPRPGFETFDNVIFVAVDEIGIDNLAWLRLKHSPGDLCTVIRPFAVEHVLDRGHQQVFYCDSDVHFFSDPKPFFDERPAADFILTPHILTPLPGNDVWVPLNIGHLTAAGTINAGMFLCRNQPGARKFLRQHAEFMSGPAAFVDELGSVRDQHYFNWVLAFGADAQLSANRCMNAAYWNLHERPLRWAQLDDGPADKWHIDGAEMISFHFSGFDWDRGRLSMYDLRPTTAWNASLHALCEYYRAALRDCGEDYYSPVDYKFGSLGGLALKADIRLEFKRSARVREPPTFAWNDAASRTFGRLNSIFGFQYLLPLYFENILHVRPDLRRSAGDERVHSPFLLRWANSWLDRDHAVGVLWEKFADFAFHKEFLAELAQAIAPYLAAAPIDTTVTRLKSDRRALLAELEAMGAPAEKRQAVASAEYRYAAVLPSQCLRLIYENWATLRVAFPDPLGRDRHEFRAWLTGEFSLMFDVPPRVSAFIDVFDVEASLARIVGFVRRNAIAASMFRAGGLSRQLLAWLIGYVNFGYGYGADDVMIADWWLLGRSEHDIAALGVFAPDDIGTASGDLYVEAWLSWQNDRAGQPADAQPDFKLADMAKYLADVGAADAAVRDVQSPGRRDGPGRFKAFVETAAVAARAAETRFAKRGPAPVDLRPQAAGINLFGYFKSPIGVGTASRGLAKAMRTADFVVRENLLLADSMDADFGLADLKLDFAFNYPRTLFVSYPHIGYRVPQILPATFMRGRETIGYLAWEQRDFPPQWRPVVEQYDTVCALSKFAADSIARGIGRPVHALPCVVEVDGGISKSAARKLHGIPEAKFVVGFVFDAGSSIERKNPAAFADAVRAAFGGNPNVLALIKIGSAGRADFSRQVDEFRARMARIGVEHRILTDYMDRARVESLIAAMDVYVSLHRSEGFGYTLAEAMMLGVPAVATGYSGNLDFMTEANSYLVRYRETIVRRRDGPFDIGSVWADPDIDDAADKLKAIYADYGRAQEKAARAKLDVENTVSVAAVAKRIKEILG